MALKYPDLRPGATLKLLNDGYFTDQPRYAGRTAEFVRYATEEELARGAGPYIVLLPGGNNFAALAEEIEPLQADPPGDAPAVVLDPSDW